jgi:alpha-tubulin suppressor-like RCC1 family protein
VKKNLAAELSAFTYRANCFTGATAIAIEAGDGHTCALLTSGGVMCWGWNDGGRLGTGSHAGSPIPAVVNLGAGVFLHFSYFISKKKGMC